LKKLSGRINFIDSRIPLLLGENQNINFEKVIAKDPGDPNLFPTENKQMGFDAGAGVNYNWKALNVGISVPQLISRIGFHLYQPKISIIPN